MPLRIVQLDWVRGGRAPLGPLNGVVISLAFYDDQEHGLAVRLTCGIGHTTTDYGGKGITGAKFQGAQGDAAE